MAYNDYDSYEYGATNTIHIYTQELGHLNVLLNNSVDPEKRKAVCLPTGKYSIAFVGPRGRYYTIYNVVLNTTTPCTYQEPSKNGKPFFFSFFFVWVSCDTFNQIHVFYISMVYVKLSSCPRLAVELQPMSTNFGWENGGRVRVAVWRWS